MSERKSAETADRFIDFIFEFYSLIRRHIVEINPYRIHSHGFTMLYSLRNSTGKSITMSDLSDKLGVTKQQLTKLVNDFEENGYVRRVRSEENRRVIFVEITDAGNGCLDEMISEILEEIKTTLKSFSESDMDKIIESTRTLSEIFRRDAMNTQIAQGSNV
jgi:DNA-binding MarR family transcriptional regulator